MGNCLLKMENVSKVFPGMKALDNVSLQVDSGLIHAVCGESGAGKSTLIGVLSGFYPFGSYSGEITLEGKLCRFRNVRDSEAAGIVSAQRQSALVPSITVAENVLLRPSRNPFRFIQWSRAYAAAAALLERVGFSGRIDAETSSLSLADLQLVLLARALGKNPKLLILDDPADSLNKKQADSLLDVLESLKKEGIAILVITHSEADIAKVADRITVLRGGQAIGTFKRNLQAGASADASYDENAIIHAMVGSRLAERFPQRKRAPGNNLIEIRGWTVHDTSKSGKKVCDNVNVTVREGELVGLAGLMGSGASELARSVFGKSYGAGLTGTIFMRGRQIQVNSPRAAIRHHFAYISEARLGRNLFANDTIASNITIANLRRASRFFVLKRREERRIAEKYRGELGIKCLSVSQSVDALSAASRLKVLLAKWLFTDPEFLILDEPAAGVDVGTKHEFYAAINSLVESGKGALLVTSETHELLGMCDRIYVMSEGRVAGEFAGADATHEAIMECILHAEKREE